jgi:cytoskeletal protein CcmA (bactofilin family)
MWKRDEAVRTPQQPSTPATAPAPAPQEPAAPRPDAARVQEKGNTVHIGKSVVIKGDLSGSEDLTIEGQVDGKIELRQNVLTIGPNGKIKAQIFAKAVIVQGDVQGNITAAERVDIRDAGSVDGDLSAPRIAIADGAHFRGSIDMQKAGSASSVPAQKAAETPKPVETKPAPDVKPAAPAAAAAR